MKGADRTPVIMQDLEKYLVKELDMGYVVRGIVNTEQRTVGLVRGVLGSSRPAHSSSFILGLSLCSDRSVLISD